MEIFSAVAKTQQPQTGTVNAHYESLNVQKTQATSQHTSKINLEQIAQKQDTEKLKQELQDLADQLNKEMNPLNTSIRFGFNDQIESLYISVIDTANDKEIRKIPSEEAMRLATKMREIVGMIFDKSV